MRVSTSASRRTCVSPISRRVGSSAIRPRLTANGVLSRGAMIIAAIAKVSGPRLWVGGKPSRAAVGELRTPDAVINSVADLLDSR